MQFPPSPQTSNLDFKYIIVHDIKFYKGYTSLCSAKAVIIYVSCSGVAGRMWGRGAWRQLVSAFHMNGAGRGRAQAYAGYPGLRSTP